MAKGESFHPELIKDVLSETVPEELKYLIKPYHKSKWEVKKPVYIGSDYYDKQKEKSYRKQYLKSIARERMYKLRIELTKSNKKHIKTRGNEKRIIRQIKKSERHLSIPVCCDVLGLKRKKFMSIQAIYNARKCTPEVYLSCNKRKKNQLTTNEVYTIKDILQDHKLMAWPVSRLHLLACQQGWASASYNSWLYIKNLFGIDRNPIRPIKSKNKKGIRSEMSNGIIHSDVCRFVLKLNEKRYLFLSMDNHSKYIVNTIIAEKTNQTINIQHFIDTMEIAKQNQYPVLAFMTDCGPENTNQKFIDAVESYGVTHLLAQTKPTPASNSMVERMFASIRKFIRIKFQNQEISSNQLEKAITEFVKIHNFELPLYKHRKTPSELYWKASDEDMFDYNEAFVQAGCNRKEANSELKCAC
jgi:hypothetical protein